MEKFLAQWMPVDASEHGPFLDRLSANVHWLMLVLFIGWGLFFVYSLWRFNAKRNPKASYHGVQSHFSTYTEAGVAVVEVILLVGFSIPMWYRWTHVPPPSANPLELRVVAEQFAWNVQYPGPDGVFGKRDIKLVTSSNPLGLDLTDPHAKDDIVTLNDLHLEKDRPVIIHVSSKDVIHSFKLPVMRVETDAIPGMEIAIHFTPVLTNETKADSDKWEIACAQLCGLGHYRMRGQLFVHSKGNFAKWLASAPPAQTSIGGS
jgi:cytochrome c oxidase subunit 2